MPYKSLLFGFLLVAALICGKGVTFAIEDGAIPGGEGFRPPPEESVLPELRGDDLRAKVLAVVNYFLTFLGLIAILAIIYFGFRLLVSGGDEEVYNLAKKGILYVGLGILLILFSFVIVQFFIEAGLQPEV